MGNNFPGFSSTRGAATSLLALCAVVSGSVEARAHPHVWVATQSTFVFDGGNLTGLRYTWQFDELYTVSATDGLDTNKDGKLDASELEELVKVNKEGLKEFDFFTVAKLFGKEIKFADPIDVSMELIEVAEAPGPQLLVPAADAPAVNAPAANAERPGLWSRFTGWVGGWFGRKPATSGAPQGQPAASAGNVPEKQKVLALHMTLPLSQPVPAASLTADSKAFQFTLGDHQLYIAFEPLPKDPIMLSSGAPTACKFARIAAELSDDEKRLQDAFGRVGGMAVGGAPSAVQVICGP